MLQLVFVGLNNLNMSANRERYITIMTFIIVGILCGISLNKCVKDNVLTDRVSDAEHMYNLYSKVQQDYSMVIKGKDSIIDILAATLDTLSLKKPDIIYIGAQTYIDTTVVTNIIYDTINNTIVKCYGFEVKNEWVDLTGVACPDTTTFKLKLRDEFIISTGSRRGLFNPEYDIFVTSKNPYVKATDIGSIRYKPKPTKFGIGFQLGYGVTRSGISPYLGVGVSYNILRL